MPLNDIQKKKAAARARKNLDKNYKHVAANVRNEQYAVWLEYAEENNISIRQLIIESVEKTIKESGFKSSAENFEQK